jgi:hypothetical protein
LIRAFRTTEEKEPEAKGESSAHSGEASKLNRSVKTQLFG